MKENIETKDVQRTEYLDKNGLDMLWAKVKENTHNQVEVERNRAVAKENSIIDTKADKSALDNYVLSTTLAEYAKKTDIPEVDTSDFVIKTARDTQTIKAPLTVTGNLQVNDIDNKTYAQLSGTQGFGQLVVFNKDTSGRSYLEGGSLQINEGPDDGIRITCQGIRNLDDNANHVYATDGSIADLTQYAKKSEITAGGNVDDVQVNGVTVVENKIANIKPATKESLGVVKVGDGLNVNNGTISVDSTAIGAGNYLPYERYTSGGGYDLPYNNDFWVKETVDNYITSTVISPGRVIANSNQGGVHLGQITNGYGVSVDYGSEIHSLLNYDSLIIYHYINNERYIGAKLNKEGIFLLDGDNNHVLTSHGSTIDITQYVLKSVYDEKIAALEARIAALEAKRAETA